MPINFPSGPIRLLREKWSTPTALAEELYAMFTAKGRVTIDEPVEIEAPRGITALRIVERERAPLQMNLGGVSRQAAAAPVAGAPGRATPEGARRRAAPEPEPSRPRGAPGAADAAQPQFAPARQQFALAPQAEERQRPAWNPIKPYDRPVFEVEGPTRFGGAPVQFEHPPLVWDDRRQEYKPITREALKPTEEPPGALGTSLGVVVSGSGDTYEVTLYPNGTRGEPGETVEVFIPQIHADEVIPAGTVLSAIYTYADGSHECQVPVYMGF